MSHKGISLTWCSSLFDFFFLFFLAYLEYRHLFTYHHILYLFNTVILSNSSKKEKIWTKKTRRTREHVIKLLYFILLLVKKLRRSLVKMRSSEEGKVFISCFSYFLLSEAHKWIQKFNFSLISFPSLYFSNCFVLLKMTLQTIIIGV